MENINGSLIKYAQLKNLNFKMRIFNNFKLLLSSFLIATAQSKQNHSQSLVSGRSHRNSESIKQNAFILTSTVGIRPHEDKIEDEA